VNGGQLSASTVHLNYVPGFNPFDEPRSGRDIVDLCRRYCQLRVAVILSTNTTGLFRECIGGVRQGG